MIYLDNAATSWPKPEAVKKAVLECFDTPLGNYGRSSHQAARTASTIVFRARENLARLFGINDSSRVIFTGSGTQALNMAIRTSLPAEGNVLVSPLEHDAVMKPLAALMDKHKIVSFELEKKTGIPDWDDFRKKLSKSKLLIMTAVSNVSGILLPWKAMAMEAEKRGCPCIIDGSQLVGKRTVNLESLHKTIFCCSGHKGLLGPTGTGVFIRPAEGEVKPLIWGGTGAARPVYPESLEPGTPNLPGIAGLGAGVVYLLDKGMENINLHFSRIITLLKNELAAIDGLEAIGFSPEQTGIVSFRTIDPALDDLPLVLDREGIAVRTGLHCAPSAHRYHQTFPAGTIRISPGIFNNENDISSLIQTIRRLLSHE